MIIKKFKKDQSAYMLTKNCGYNKAPEIKIVTVTSVGKKYVTVSCDIRFQNDNTDGDYLIESVNWGDRRLLFADEIALNEFLERAELMTWFRKTKTEFGRLSLQKLRELRKIVEEPEQKAIALNFDRDGTYFVRHLMAPKSKADDICTMVEKVRQNAINAGCVGWLSEVPVSYFESVEVGFRTMDIMNVTMDDVGLAETEYEKNGYFIPACKDCYRYSKGFCSRYDAKVTPDDMEECFCDDNAVFYKIQYCHQGSIKTLVRFYRRKQEGTLHHSTKDIFKMFAITHEDLSNMLERDDFNLAELYITDGDENTFPNAETENNVSTITS